MSEHLVVRQFSKSETIEVAGPITPENIEEIAAWCGGLVDHTTRTRLVISHIGSLDRMFANLGELVIKYQDGSHKIVVDEITVTSGGYEVDAPPQNIEETQ